MFSYSVKPFIVSHEVEMLTSSSSPYHVFLISNYIINLSRKKPKALSEPKVVAYPLYPRFSINNSPWIASSATMAGSPNKSRYNTPNGLSPRLLRARRRFARRIAASVTKRSSSSEPDAGGEAAVSPSPQSTSGNRQQVIDDGTGGDLRDPCCRCASHLTKIDFENSMASINFRSCRDSTSQWFGGSQALSVNAKKAAIMLQKILVRAAERGMGDKLRMQTKLKITLAAHRWDRALPSAQDKTTERRSGEVAEAQVQALEAIAAEMASIRKTLKTISRRLRE
ncbi:hypothetical protein ACRALDRAFT_211266 [Sodiomyces alcalophilus JCM 7366]|uniref:uncharacterized protein n=1 Tax=Sodiomyces alcalophilus JCM 7366 TaxID=591952 RepID=UPI0039B664C0